MDYSSNNTLGVSARSVGVGPAYASNGYGLPTSVGNAMGSYSSFTGAATPSFPFATQIYDGTAVGGEETMLNDYSSKVYQPGARIKQGPKPITYLAKPNPELGLHNQWLPGMPMFAITSDEKSLRPEQRTKVVRPARSITMMSAPQLNILLQRYYIENRDKAIFDQDLAIHEDARKMDGDDVQKREKWACTIKSIGMYLTYIGILMNTHENKNGHTKVNISKFGRTVVPNYWGPSVSEGNHIGFIIKRIPTGQQQSGPFQLVPWHSGSHLVYDKPKSHAAPSSAERRYMNIYPNGRTEVAEGIYYGAGTVLHAPPQQNLRHRKPQQDDNLAERLLATSFYTSSSAYTSSVNDAANVAAQTTMSTVKTLEIEPSMPRWLKAIS